LLCGVWTRSRHVKSCFSRGIPRSLKRSRLIFFPLPCSNCLRDQWRTSHDQLRDSRWGEFRNDFVFVEKDQCHAALPEKSDQPLSFAGLQPGEQRVYEPWNRLTLCIAKSLRSVPNEMDLGFSDFRAKPYHARLSIAELGPEHSSAFRTEVERKPLQVAGRSTNRRYRSTGLSVPFRRSLTSTLFPQLLKGGFRSVSQHAAAVVWPLHKKCFLSARPHPYGKPAAYRSFIYFDRGSASKMEQYRDSLILKSD
jgi:hypothetical protein